MLPYNRPNIGEREIAYIMEVIGNEKLAGDGPFTKRCHNWLSANLPTLCSLITPSCTVALEMAALLVNIKAGDEVILPSYTFASSANSIVLRGGVPVFADIRVETRNLDERLIEGLITSRTRAIMPVHYAAIACDMDEIMAIATRHGLMVIEDAAQGVGASYRGRALGTIGHLGALSFHETKTVACGEGGALLTNDPDLARRAEVVREKGTNRSQFLRGEIDKYTWQDVGTSGLPPEIVAAFLLAQLENAAATVDAYRAVWNRYHALLDPLEAEGLLTRPVVPEGCRHNGHIYAVLLNSETGRQHAINGLKAAGIHAVSHYVPLHSAPAGLRYGRTPLPMPGTDRVAETLLRLPIWVGLMEADQERVVGVLAAVLRRRV